MPFVDEASMEVENLDFVQSSGTPHSDPSDSDNHTIPPFVLNMLLKNENNANVSKQASLRLANLGVQNKPNWMPSPNSSSRGDPKPKEFFSSGNREGEGFRSAPPQWIGQLKLNKASSDSSDENDLDRLPGVLMKPSLTDDPRLSDSVSLKPSKLGDQNKPMMPRKPSILDDVDKPSDASPKPSNFSQQNEHMESQPTGSDSGDEAKTQETHRKHSFSHKQNQPKGISSKLSKILDPKSHIGIFQALPPADTKTAESGQGPAKDDGAPLETPAVDSVAASGPKPSASAGSSSGETEGESSESAASKERVEPAIHSSTLNLTAWKSVQKERKRLMRMKCEEHRLKPRRGMYDTKSIVDRHKNFLYCPVEKSASTFLRRFMYSLGNSSRSREISSPFDVPIQTALRYSFDTLRSLFHKGGKDFMENSVKLIVVREPFSRLFSAYVDKLVVPNSYYWDQWGTRAISRYRKSPTSQSLLCGHDVTFPEFVKYVIGTLHVSDAHVQPVNTLCSPCEIKFSVIGHLETLQSDFEYLTSVLKISIDNFNVETLTSDVISDAIADSTFSAFEPYDNLQSCVSKFETCKRLWRKMQLRGIINDKFRFPLRPHEAEKVTASKFVKIVNDARERSQDSDKLRLQKFQALHDAYKEVSAEDIMQLVKIYYLDFEIFGFDKHPSFIA